MDDNVRQYISNLFKINIIPNDNLKVIKQGRNSKVFKLRIKKKDIIVKIYANDHLARLEREVKFYKFIQKNEIRNISKLIAFSKKNNIAVFTYINGFRTKKISNSHILKAANFIKRLNTCENTNKLNYMAVDGITKISDHYKNCHNRIRKLMSLAKSKKDKELQHFIVNSINNKYIQLYENLKYHHFDKLKKIKIRKKDLIISPSDFGFHNAIEKNNKLYFFDFEYSGKDDPTKLICDFLSQPDQILSKKQETMFKRIFFKHFSNYHNLEYLVELFLPFHKLKWCCIILNEFHHDKRQIRTHAGRFDNETLNSQLNKAKKYFNKNFEGF